MRQMLNSWRHVRPLRRGRDETERLSECDGTAYGEPNLLGVLGCVGDDGFGLLDLVDEDVDGGWGEGVPVQARGHQAGVADRDLQDFLEQAFEVRAGGEQDDALLSVAFAHERSSLSCGAVEQAGSSLRLWNPTLTERDGSTHDGGEWRCCDADVREGCEERSSACRRVSGDVNRSSPAPDRRTSGGASGPVARTRRPLR